MTIATTHHYTVPVLVECGKPISETSDLHAMLDDLLPPSSYSPCDALPLCHVLPVLIFTTVCTTRDRVFD